MSSNQLLEADDFYHLEQRYASIDGKKMKKSKFLSQWQPLRNNFRIQIESSSQLIENMNLS